MGEILGTKITGEGKVIFTIAAEHEEALQLKGHVEDIHLFTEKVSDIKTNIACRGKNAATKYFLIPREFRRNLKFDDNEISCQKIETKSKIMFVYVIDKFKLQDRNNKNRNQRF